MASSIVDGLCNGLDNGKEAIQEKINDLMKNVISKQLDVFVIQKSMSGMFQKWQMLLMKTVPAVLNLPTGK